MEKSLPYRMTSSSAKAGSVLDRDGELVSMDVGEGALVGPRVGDSG